MASMTRGRDKGSDLIGNKYLGDNGYIHTIIDD